MTTGAVVGRQVGDVLVGQTLRNAAHAGVLALAFLVSVECRRNIFGALTRDHRHLINLRKSGFVTDDAMATDAHRIFAFASFCIARELLSLAGKRHEGDSCSEYRGEKLVHFARTIE